MNEERGLSLKASDAGVIHFRGLTPTQLISKLTPTEVTGQDRAFPLAGGVEIVWK